METIEPGVIINQEAPTIYREIARKMLLKCPDRTLPRKEAKVILGMCFKVGKYKSKVLKELIDYGLLVWINKREYFITYKPLEGEEDYE